LRREKVDRLDEGCGERDEETAKRGLVDGPGEGEGTYVRIKAAKAKMKRIMTCGP
jgi:hypothetical protein